MGLEWVEYSYRPYITDLVFYRESTDILIFQSIILIFTRPDAGAHMSEELKDASKELPRAMMWSITLNGILGITMVISFCFCIKDVEAFVNSVSY
jgi:amino acid transporter